MEASERIVTVKAPEWQSLHVAEASRVWRRKWSPRRRRAFAEVVCPLILLGLFLEFLFLFVLQSAAVEWLLVLPAVGTLLGLMWLVSREPANLYAPPQLCVARWDALTHWYDDLLVEAKAYVGEKRDLVINAGLSVSGLQHVGRLRGEVMLSQLLTRSFRDHRRNALQSLVLYTQDEWKAKETQVAQFTKEDGRKYAGRRLIDVPDPAGCHANWVEHFWQDFGGVLNRFAPGIRIVTTTDTYRNPEMQALVRDLASRAEEVRATVNKYRTRHPYPPGWIPFEAFCESCGTIGATTTSIDGTLASYRCERCGHIGKSSIEKGKLNWRLEWPALWKVYRVDIEPFGKDHATFDRAEAAFYSEKRQGDEDDQARSYELAYLASPPKEKPFALSYRHASFLSQISPESGQLEWCLKRMRDTGMLTRRATEFESARIARRLAQSRVWVEKYATENRVKLLESLMTEVKAQLDQDDRKALRLFATKAAAIRWNEDSIKESMVSLTKKGGLPVETGRFFRDLYLVLLGSEKGPRAAPFLAVLEKDWVLRRLNEAAQ